MPRQPATNGGDNNNNNRHHGNKNDTSERSSPSSSMSGRYISRAQIPKKAMDDSCTSLIKTPSASQPVGIRLLDAIGCMPRSPSGKRTLCKWLVLFLTYLAYVSFHMGRRPMSIVKNVLHPEKCNPNNTQLHKTTNYLHVDNYASADAQAKLEFIHKLNSEPCGWAPFDDNDTASSLLGIVDTGFLSAYAIFMFVSGFVAERMNLRYFVSMGCALSGVFLITTGLAESFQIHSLTFFIGTQLLSGVAQTTGWPVVVTCVDNWFDKSERSFIFGLWNSHTNVGNILGALIAGVFVETHWGLSFIVPGGIMVVMGLVLFLFLVPKPNDVGLSSSSTAANQHLAQQQHPDFGSTGHQNPIMASRHSLASSASGRSDESDVETASAATTYHETSYQRSGASQHLSPDLMPVGESEPVGFIKALGIPGVVEYSLCLFFSKLVIYTFLFWLPKYIAKSMSCNSQDSAFLSIWFDLGGTLGAAIAGILSNKFDYNGSICVATLILAMPAMFAYDQIGSKSVLNNILLQSLVGALVNGPYCLITTSVSADLGARIKDKHATATVAAIIDGMGSLGAVVGALVAGFIANSHDWNLFFTILIASNALAALCLTRIVVGELKSIFGSHQDPSAV